ncbi:Cytochrome c biogenesis factor OS=Tsukamurella paurometabola (strain ATCC 8368 / DSM / CCUG 35730 / CIP 100753 / JCM 10117 / KCTC 9821 / NBRC 16120 / NCIMB 702349 / NCTC 13040) OX=521096 GN=Tpau_1757 PE=4 SV=1 [Tsukamurella paurometabola]|uniref:Cytochrome c biogenesis factor n=1 Tax=Tsukamurella paurometabola (strain ATCC 8368 / DSM 20162 / CCUG 35730 / CIP 100753 / JCM 10117 / KCTC 9821 / NBRC 16120 / NCIMB 702349 / NCTC 13040) TaxID=521096 RepID=D5UM95_TSUPD|nr:hypothetical protein [Tsukamurella paurometabola]ADG78375.1 conserved hypothetical protein [Tsukamurella paurometabola DSM 20162]SUP31402.1 Uncharacterised protein [Tsukamurella paurometabola]
MTGRSSARSNLGPLLVIGFLSVAMLVYIGLIGVWAWMIMRRGGGANLGLGAGMIVLGIVGLWILYSVLRNGYAHQRLAAQAKELGRDLDVSDLPKMPSGRVDRDCADALFAEVKAEYEADPDSWVNVYRLARAYDYAGDRSRARDWMTRAVSMEKKGR